MAIGLGHRGLAVFGAAIGLVCLIAGGAHADPSAMRMVVDREASRFMQSQPGAVGIALGVIHDGDRLSLNYGNLVRGHAGAPTDKTIFPIASITKTFTGVLLAQAALEHRVRLDDDVRKYLPEAYPNLEFQHHPIRLMDLLDHRSGLPFLLPDVPEGMPDFGHHATPWTARVAALEAYYTRQDFLRDLHKVVLIAAPGDTVSYSNAGATLMGYILESVYGQDFEALLRAKILDRLGMRDTGIVQTAAQVGRTAWGYDGQGNIMPAAPIALGAAAGLKSSVADLLAYAAWGIAEDDPVIRLAHAPVARVAPEVTGLKYPYLSGLNWQEILATDSTGTRRVIWQSGGMDGFASYCVEEPELHLAVVALFNEADPGSAKAQQAMLNAILVGLDRRALTLP